MSIRISITTCFNSFRWCLCVSLFGLCINFFLQQKIVLDTCGSMISSFSLLISRYFSMTEYLYWTECVCFGLLHTYCDCLSIYRFFNPVFFVRPHSCGSIGLYRCVFSFFLFNLMHTLSKRVYSNDSNVERFIQSATYNVNHNQLAGSKMNLYAKIAHTISIRFFCFCEWRSVCVSLTTKCDYVH